MKKVLANGDGKFAVSLRTFFCILLKCLVSQVRINNVSNLNKITTSALKYFA